jgi:hypothetical protein
MQEHYIAIYAIYIIIRLTLIPDCQTIYQPTNAIFKKSNLFTPESNDVIDSANGIAGKLRREHYLIILLTQKQPDYELTRSTAVTVKPRPRQN